jgi:hypothetical protein
MAFSLLLIALYPMRRKAAPPAGKPAPTAVAPKEPEPEPKPEPKETASEKD